MTQTTLLPKMGAPLRKLTAAQIAAEQQLYLQTAYNVTHRARVLGINRSTLDWHLNAVRQVRPRVPARVQALIDAGDQLLAIAPRTEAAWQIRLAWSNAKTAITRRKTNK